MPTDRLDRPAVDHVDLPISGMTCGSCAARIERGLNRLDGVEATVNYLTGKASVDFDPSALGRVDLVATVEHLGYRVADGGVGPVPAPASAVTADAPAPSTRVEGLSIGSLGRARALPPTWADLAGPEAMAAAPPLSRQSLAAPARDRLESPPAQAVASPPRPAAALSRPEPHEPAELVDLRRSPPRWRP